MKDNDKKFENVKHNHFDEKDYDKKAAKAEKEAKKIEKNSKTPLMDGDPFKLDPKLLDPENISESILNQADRILGLDYRGIKTIYGTEYTDDVPRLAKDPVFVEKNGIGYDTARRLLNFSFIREHIPLIKNGVVQRKEHIKGFPQYSSKGKLVSPSMSASNIAKLLRRLIGINNVPSKCTSCGYNFMVPNMRFKRDLSQVFQDLSIDSFSLACFLHPSNVYLYCKVCDGMRQMQEVNKDPLFKERKDEWWKLKIGQKTIFEMMGKKEFSQNSLFGLIPVMKEPFSKSVVQNPKDNKNIEEHLDGDIEEIKPFKAA